MYIEIDAQILVKYLLNPSNKALHMALFFRNSRLWHFMPRVGLK